MRAGQRKAGRRVVKHAVRPENGVVAILAGGREVGLHVIYGRQRIVVIGLVTRDAGRVGDVVVIVDVTIGALPRRRGVCAHQRKSGLRVIKARRLPGRGRVADVASLREVPLHVIRIRSSVEILEVTGNASRRRQVVIIVDVAVGALTRRDSMRAGQRESGLRVVEVRGLPGCRRVADFASLRQVRLHVVRIRSGVEILEVTRHAGRRRQVVIIVDVAIGASPRWHGVRTRQRERCGGVIELCRRPGHRRMAILTGRREYACLLGVIRIRCVGVVVLVAGDAGRVGGRQIVVVVLVAIDAGPWRHSMAAAQYEAGDGVIEVGVRPVVRVMAVLAGRIRKKVGRGVRRIHGAAEILLMAADAIRRHRCELAQSTALMAVLAGQGRVRPGEREAVVVHVDLADVYVPAPDRMATLAGARHLATVNIGVTGSALGAHIAEHHLRMAVHAINALVHAPQRKLGLIVVEFRHRTDRLPAVHRVAVLASDIQVAVRTPSIVGRRG